MQALDVINGVSFRGPTNIIMLFKCGTCTFVMDSKVHGNRPCQMCGEENPKRLPLDRWDVVDAEEYNSLFPPVADFRAAIGRPTNESAAATAKSTETSAPQKKKPACTLQPMVGGERLTCTCATCVFLAERRQKMKRAGVTEEK